MTVTLLNEISRYQGVSGDVKPTDVLTGSTFYEVDTGDWFVWDGDSWESYTFPLLDALSPSLPSVDEKAAMNAASAPDASNPFATIADLGFAIYLADGQDETGDATITVTGVVTGDVVVGCLVLATKASIATLTSRAAADFSVTGTNEITVGAHAANTTNNQYVFFVRKAA
jgi:hypothetical protein